MSEKFEPIIKRAFLLLLAILMLAGAGNAPENRAEYREEMAKIELLFGELDEYKGYQTLMNQIGLDETIEVIQLIENSDYPEMVKAIIEVESAWKVRALSNMDAIGLMQIRMIAATEVEPGINSSQLYNPTDNVRIGISIFENHMAYFTNYTDTEHWALTAYNRGRTGTFNLKLKPPRTRYSNKVLDIRSNTGFHSIVSVNNQVT
ncbi:MAG: lytic transglycosylase domain-containing protein [Candidatus Hatepunaea meridiana]|nr:lytic transglycosylase domain-containing protein [Candidatus Hatepunaea meridiana]